MNVSIMDGTGQGGLASVTAGGSLKTEVGNTVDVAVGNTVTVERAGLSAYRTRGTVGTSSGTLLSARTGRQGLFLQNQGANPVYLRFGSAAATNQDWLVAPGGEFRAEDFRYADVVTAIAAGGNADVLALELAP